MFLLKVLKALMSIFQKPQNLFKYVKIQVGFQKTQLFSALLAAPAQILDLSIGRNLKLSCSLLKICCDNTYVNEYFTYQNQTFVEIWIFT